MLLAHRIVPGADPGRFVVTAVLGMTGAFMGGFVLGVLVGSGEVRVLAGHGARVRLLGRR